jgi:hypothetical protein
LLNNNTKVTKFVTSTKNYEHFFKKKDFSVYSEAALGESIALGIPGFARHALSSIPELFRAELLADALLVFPLHRIRQAARVIVVKLRSRTDGGTHAAIHATVHPLLEVNVLFQSLQQCRHGFHFCKNRPISLPGKAGKYPIVDVYLYLLSSVRCAVTSFSETCTEEKIQRNTASFGKRTSSCATLIMLLF